jgi:serine/threonine protein kinase
MVDRPGHRVLNGRFELLERIRTEGRHRAYVGRDLANDARVFVKQLPWSEIRDWKTVELFEREAATLRAISHPNLPKFVDAFHLEEDPKLGFFLVQQLIAGRNLKFHIDAGKPLRERSLGMVAESVLNALHALHSANPGLIHRDVKPANIVSDVEQVVLVDLGVVGTAPEGLAVGETLAGTPGYMAPEQTNGRAVPASDLYSLGLTLIHAASLVHPSKLPVERLRVRFRDVLSLSEPWLRFLERLVEPALEDRFKSAAAALSSLPAARSRSESVPAAASPRVASFAAPAPALPTFELEPVIAPAKPSLESSTPPARSLALEPVVAAPSMPPPPVPQVSAPLPVPAPVAATVGAVDADVQVPVPVDQALDTLLERILNGYPLRQLAERFHSAPVLFGVVMLLAGLATEWTVVERRAPTRVLLERRAAALNAEARLEGEQVVYEALQGTDCFREETSGLVRARVEFEGGTGLARSIGVYDGGSSSENACLRTTLKELSLTKPGPDDQVVNVLVRLDHGKAIR